MRASKALDRASANPTGSIEPGSGPIGRPSVRDQIQTMIAPVLMTIATVAHGRARPMRQVAAQRA